MGGLGHCLAGVLPGLGQVLDKKLAKKVVAKKVAKRVWRKNGGEKNNRKNRKANQADTMECHPPDKWKAKSWLPLYVKTGPLAFCCLPLLRFLSMCTCFGGAGLLGPLPRSTEPRSFPTINDNFQHGV